MKNLGHLGTLFLSLLLSLNLVAYDEVSEEENLLALFGDEEIISIATGIAQPISKAPAVASVITQDHIKRIGATDIDEALEMVPGLHVGKDVNGNPLYIFRGVNASFNPQVLMLINGIPLTNLFQGDRNLVWGGMPVEAISRIEVIRGPGSAVYGADAFSGVINIVTKNASEIDGFSGGVRAGRFNTTDIWLQTGGRSGEVEYAAVLEFHQTDGHDGVITADAQTFLDLITVGQAAPVSNAPGSVSLSRENIDARFELSYQRLTFRAGAQIRKDAGIGAGLGLALDPTSRSSSDRWNADITYDNPEFLEDMGLTVQLSYLDVSQEVDENLILFPAGSAGPFIDGAGNPFFGFFPDGVIGNPEVFERHTRFNISSSYTGISRNDLRFGIGYYYGDVHEVREEKNFGGDPNNCLDPANPLTCAPILPGSGLVDVTDTPLVFLEEDQRENYYAFVQDVIQLSNDWEFTVGFRYDDYSDFGSTFNPRLALVWSTSHNLTTKLLYGQAFRAPSFAQTRAINNPVVLGNPDLDPEELESYELAFDYHPRHNLGLNVNFFYYKWDDIIQFVPDAGGSTSTAQNAGEQTGYGMEFEASWDVNEHFDLTGNFALQQSTDEDLNADAANSPEKQFYLQANWNPAENWHLNLQANWVLDRNRMTGDFRPDIDDYFLVDLAVRRKELIKGLELSLLVKNLFDEDAREPSTITIPNDLPQAGRSVLGEIRYQF